MKFYLYSNYDPTSKGFYLLETEEEFTFEKIKYITMGIVKIRMDINPTFLPKVKEIIEILQEIYSFKSDLKEYSLEDVKIYPLINIIDIEPSKKREKYEKEAVEELKKDKIRLKNIIKKIFKNLSKELEAEGELGKHLKKLILKNMDKNIENFKEQIPKEEFYKI